MIQQCHASVQFARCRVGLQQHLGQVRRGLPNSADSSILSSCRPYFRGQDEDGAGYRLLRAVGKSVQACQSQSMFFGGVERFRLAV